MTHASDESFVAKTQKEITLFSHINALLGWDKEIYLPHAGHDERSDQEALMSRLSHEQLTSPALQKAVKRLLAHKTTPHQRAILERLEKDIQKAQKLPPSFVESLSKATGQAYSVWVKARKQKNFKVFAPALEKVIALKQKQSDYMHLKGHVYNGVLDDFEEGMTVKQLDPVFDSIKDELIPLIHLIESSPAYRQKKIKIEMNEESQKRVGDVFIKRLLDPQRSRLDLSIHPFTNTSGLHDVRITTSYERGFEFSFYSTIHEAGHALYELQMPQKFANTAAHNDPSTGLHESQSRFWENMAGKRESFLKFYQPMIQREIKRKISLTDLHRAFNQVERGLIRIQADEVHYPLHVIIRYEIEKGLLDGSIQVKDLPREWNDRYEKYIGVRPKNDTQGVLQDVHWSIGAIGYFPTYVIGTVYSAQLWNQIESDMKNIDSLLQKGNYTPIKKWLEKNVHQYGRTMSADQIIQKATGEGLNAKPFLHYLTNKYAQLYGE